MQTSKKIQIIRFILFSNGVVDIIAAIALFFPVLGIPLPGYGAYAYETAFVAGGWGIAALTFGIGRIWASYKSEFYRFMVVLGLIEGTILSLYCLLSVLFLEVTLLQSILPLSVGTSYGILYFGALVILFNLDGEK